MKVLGLGNALVDIMTQIENDEFLSENNLPKGSMQLVDFTTSSAVLKAAEGFKKSMASGGSAAKYHPRSGQNGCRNRFYW